MKNKILILASFLLIIILFGCNTIEDEVLASDVNPPDSTGFAAVSSVGITLKYKIDEDELHCILSANTSGWIAVGFDPSSMMKDANFIIGYTANGTGFIRDDWGVSNTTHTSDLLLGGSDDVSLISASESNGITELEFKIPLDSGDQYDTILSPDQTYQIILANGDEDDFESYHSVAGFAEITLGSE